MRSLALSRWSGWAAGPTSETVPPLPRLAHLWAAGRLPGPPPDGLTGRLRVPREDVRTGGEAASLGRLEPERGMVALLPYTIGKGATEPTHRKRRPPLGRSVKESVG